MKEKIEKMFFVFHIIPSDFVEFSCLYLGRIVAIGNHCVRKKF